MKIHLNIKNERKKLFNDFERISGSIFGKVYPSKYECFENDIKGLQFPGWIDKAEGFMRRTYLSLEIHGKMV